MSQFFGVAQFNSFYLCRHLSTHMSFVIDCCNEINNWWQQLIYLAPKCLLQNLTIHRWIKQKKTCQNHKMNNEIVWRIHLSFTCKCYYQFFILSKYFDLLYFVKSFLARVTEGFFYNKVSMRYYNNSIILLSNIWILLKLYLIQLPWCCYK